MDNKELQSICGMVKNVSKRLSMSLAPLGYNYVIFNDPKHIFANIKKYDDYANRDVVNIYDGVVRNSDGKLEPTCGFSISSIYPDIENAPKWANEIKGKLSQGMLVMPYEVGDIIEYYKNDKDGDEHRHISHIVFTDGKYQIFGDEDIDLESIAIAIRENENITDEIERIVSSEKLEMLQNNKGKNPYTPLIDRLTLMLDVAYELSDYFEDED